MYETKEERSALFDFMGKYTEVDLLNKRATGFGWAVLVVDNFEAKRRKVVKLPNRDEATQELLSEAEILTKISQYLRHRNLIELYSVERYVIDWQGRKQERWFIVLQYGGSALRSRLGRLAVKADMSEYVYTDGHPLPIEEVLQIATQVTDGLRALHDFEEAPGQHIIHRDIKPENILIGEDGVARLADFGISKVVERITQSVTVAGTPPYLAPEYSRGRFHATSDIYSLGIVLYEMATGRFPFRTPQDRFYEMPALAHTLNPAVPPALSEVIHRSLFWDPKAERKEESQRYQSAAEMLQDLKRCFSRMFPVPPRFQKLQDAQGKSGGLYQDTHSAGRVRIFLYVAEQPRVACSRVTGLTVHKLPGLVFPTEAFESDAMLGVAAPLAPPAAPLLGAVDTTRGEAVTRLAATMAQFCRELKRLHQLGIYHGFLHPRNVLRSGTNWVLDEVWLGQLVGLVDSQAFFSANHELLGYTAPEVLAWRLPPGLASDIYGVGAVLYGILCGQPPFDADATIGVEGAITAARGGLQLRGKVRTLTRRFESVIVKALLSDPAQRHHSLEELIAELEACRWPEDAVESLIADAVEAQRLGRMHEAYDALDQALVLDPGNPRVHHARAEIFFLEGSPKWALAENEKALNIDPTSNVLYLHGQCLLALNDPAEAEAAVRLGLRQEDCSRGRHLLALCLEHSGNHQQALEQYERAREKATAERNFTMVEKIHADFSALLKKMKD